MAYTYDLTEAVGKVRLYSGDKHVQGEPIFSDEELTVFLDEEGGDVLLAAAQALDVIAADEALVQKVITTGDLTTNGAATAQALREQAKMLRSRAQDEYGFVNIGLAIYGKEEDIDV